MTANGRFTGFHFCIETMTRLCCVAAPESVFSEEADRDGPPELSVDRSTLLLATTELKKPTERCEHALEESTTYSAALHKMRHDASASQDSFVAQFE